MSFLRPELLWLALALPAVVAVALRGWLRRRRRALDAVGEPRLLRRLGWSDDGIPPAARVLLLCAAAAAIGVAAAGPTWGFRTVEGRARALSVVLALDASRSLLAEDVEPNRLERERLLARQLLRELSGERVGLVIFAGRAYVLSPLTVDHGALELYLDALDPAVVSQGGSSLAAALAQAADLARAEQAGGGDRAVVLISDGEALEERDDVLAMAERAAELGVVVHTVGIGTEEGARVPEVDPATGRVVGYTIGPDGRVVISRLDERLLREVAEVTGGTYVRLGEGDATDRLLSAIRGMRRGETSGGRMVERRERYAWFVFLALALLGLDAALASARRVPPTTAEETT